MFLWTRRLSVRVTIIIPSNTRYPKTSIVYAPALTGYSDSKPAYEFKATKPTFLLFHFPVAAFFCRIKERNTETKCWQEVLGPTPRVCLSTVIMLHPQVSIFFLLFLSGLTLSHQAHFPSNELVVRANSGTYKGITTEAAPHVRQFLQIPYALPPIGSRRWLPPVKPFSNASSAYDATTFPPSCPQYRSKVPSLQSQDSPEFQIFANGQSPTVGASAANTSEDCLYLAVWTPAGVKTSNLPVIMFMTGGGFETGGINILAQLPHHWVERTQAHIVITVKSVPG